MANILIIDDDRAICKVMSNLINNHGHDVTFALTLTDGLHKVATNAYDVIFLDVRLPDGIGLDAIQKIKANSSAPEVVIITGEGDPNGAELAIQYGAWDYIEKPPSVQSVILPLVRALQYRTEKKDTQKPLMIKRENIIGNSPQLLRSLNKLARAAQSQASVLIEGETGTGKELFAMAIHQNSSRSGKNFVVVDCAALPETLVESVLFGHAKGAFTGADQAKEGLVKQADQGTLFLDEIGELPFSLQKAFLRVLQEQRFRPIGKGSEVESDFRLIAATNRDLDRMVQEKQFRQDLLFRIRSLVITLPPLRERPEDIRLLVMHFLNQYCDRRNISTKGLSPDFIEALSTYNWPGNIRELENSMRSILSEAGDAPILYPKHLPTYIRVHITRRTLKDNKPSPEPSSKKNPIRLAPFKAFRNEAVAAAEKRYLENLTAATQWNIQEACRVSELSRPRLYALLKKHALSRPSKL